MNGVFGKFRAIVTLTNDPEHSGRVKVRCPRLYGDFESPWCLPCVPLAADGAGFMMVPKVGEVVWIELEEGDPDLPIWVGGFWGEAKAPLTSGVSDKRLLKTEAGHEILMDGSTLHIKHSSGSIILIDAGGAITITSSANQATINANTTINGNVVVNGNETVNGNLSIAGGTGGGGGLQASGNADIAGTVTSAETTSSGVSLTGHTHSDPQGGTVGTPQ